MINQKAISVRIHVQTLWNIEQEVQLGETNRNKLLNDGANLYLATVDTRRRFRMIQDKPVRRKILYGFLKLYFPEALEIL